MTTMPTVSRTTAALVAFVLAVAAGLALGILALTPVGERAGLLAAAGKTIAPAIGTLVTLAAAGLAAHKASSAGKAARSASDAATGAQDAAQAQAPVLEQIRHQTNGALTSRITDVVNAALDSRGLGIPAPSLFAGHAPEAPAPAAVVVAPVSAAAVVTAAPEAAPAAEVAPATSSGGFDANGDPVPPTSLFGGQ